MQSVWAAPEDSWAGCRAKLGGCDPASWLMPGWAGSGLFLKLEGLRVRLSGAKAVRGYYYGLAELSARTALAVPSLEGLSGHIPFSRWSRPSRRGEEEAGLWPLTQRPSPPNPRPPWGSSIHHRPKG